MIPRVRHIMKKEPLTADMNYTVTRTVKMMIDSALETLIVTCEGRILGAVSIDDLLLRLIEPNFNPDRTSIGEITNSEVVLVRPSTRLEDAIALMLEIDHSTLPVVDSEIVGYIGYTDILRVVNRIEVTQVIEDRFDPQKFIV